MRCSATKIRFQRVGDNSNIPPDMHLESLLAVPLIPSRLRRSLVRWRDVCLINIATLWKIINVAVQAHKCSPTCQAYDDMSPRRVCLSWSETVVMRLATACGKRCQGSAEREGYIEGHDIEDEEKAWSRLLTTQSTGN